MEEKDMAKILLLLLGVIVIANVINPGVLIGTVMALVEWALFEIAWWQLLLLVCITVALTRYICYCIKKAKK